MGSGGVSHLSHDEEKEYLDTFAAVFTVLEPFNFRDVFQGSIRVIFGTGACVFAAACSRA